jgi:nitrogen fixation/metabolism regulation signal transduction histidine kinase
MKRFSILAITRIILIVANALLLAWIFGDMQLFFNQIILGLILVFQVWELIHFINHTNRELARLFMAVKHSDFSVTFNQPSLGKSFSELQTSLTEIIKSYRDVKIDKEAQYQFLQLLVNQIQVGIISVMQNDITLINPVAEKIAGVKGVRNWKILENMNPSLAAQLKDEGKRLIEIKSPGEAKILAVEVTQMMMIDKPYRLITLQDINSEIEQKEIEAWHKLIRILTHEIMNSVTPIASLSETMQAMLSNRSSEDIGEDIINDIQFSLNTIQKRSERLIDFVENYRRLTRVPKPVTQTVGVQSFLLNMENLMREEIGRKQISLTLDVEDANLEIKMDPALVEQVLINLLRNSIHAVEEKMEGRIEVKAYTDEKNVVMEVNDNGKGIPDKELKEIFVPFFSTKKDGSGIGLSLSKQIMSLHGGRIKVSSVVNEGTTFFLVFPR